jgi:hypothetical protein
MDDLGSYYSYNYPVLTSLHVKGREVMLRRRNPMPWTEEPGRCIDTGSPLHKYR